MHNLPRDVAAQSGLDRRGFLRLGACGAAAVYFLPAFGCHEQGGVHMSPNGRPIPWQIYDARMPIVWIETGVCTGCACSLLASLSPPAETLVPDLLIDYQETLMDSFGCSAIDRLVQRLQAGAPDERGLILVVDGAIPRGDWAPMTTAGQTSDGRELSAEELVGGLAALASTVVALGTCACFGGIPSSQAAVAAYVSLSEIMGSTPIRIPGCPPNPSWITTAFSAVLRGEPIDVDALGRPTAFFGKIVHDQCPRQASYVAGDLAQSPGDAMRCLLRVGCKGTVTLGDCPSRLWQGASYCIKANHPCIGCTSPGFLDGKTTVDGNAVGSSGQAMSPVYAEPKALP